jgi:hypothetical protein
MNITAIDQEYPKKSTAICGGSIEQTAFFNTSKIPKGSLPLES